MPDGVVANAQATRDLNKILALFLEEGAANGLSIAEIAKRTKLKEALVLDVVRNKSLEPNAQLNLTRFMVYSRNPQAARTEPEEAKERHVAALSKDSNFVQLSQMFTRALANASFRTEDEVSVLGSSLAYFYYISKQHEAVAWDTKRVKPTMLEERLATIARPNQPGDTRHVLDAFLRLMLRRGGTPDQNIEFIPDNVLTEMYREAIRDYALGTGVVSEKRFELTISDGREWRQMGFAINPDKILLYQTRENVLHDRLRQEDYISSIEGILDGNMGRVTDGVLSWLRETKLAEEMDDSQGVMNAETGALPKVLKVSPEVLKYMPALRQKVIESAGRGANLTETLTYTRFLVGRLKTLGLNTVDDLRRYEFVPQLSVAKMPVRFEVEWEDVTLDNLKPLVLQIYGLPEDSPLARVGHEEEFKQWQKERQPLTELPRVARPPRRDRPAAPRREPQPRPPPAPRLRTLETRVSYTDLSLLMTTADTQNYIGDKAALLRAFLEEQGHSSIGANAIADDFLTNYGPERMRALAEAGSHVTVDLFLHKYVAGPAVPSAPVREIITKEAGVSQAAEHPVARPNHPREIGYEHFAAAALALGLQTPEEREGLVRKVGPLAEIPKNKLDSLARRLSDASKNLGHAVTLGLGQPKTLRWIVDTYRSQIEEAPVAEAAPVTQPVPAIALPAPQSDRKIIKTYVPETKAREMAEEIQELPYVVLAAALKAAYDGSRVPTGDRKAAITFLMQLAMEKSGQSKEDALRRANSFWGNVGNVPKKFKDYASRLPGDEEARQVYETAGVQAWVAQYGGETLEGRAEGATETPQATAPAAAAMLGHGDIGSLVETYARALNAAAATGRPGVAVVQEQIEQGLGALARYHTYANREVAAAEAAVAGRRTALGALEAALGGTQAK